jgi:hypothetical protein
MAHPKVCGEPRVTAAPVQIRVSSEVDAKETQLLRCTNYDLHTDKTFNS